MRFSTRTGLGRVFAAEAVVTFVPVLVITAVTTDNKVPRGAAAVAIGAALAAAILISGPISGAGVNPARAIGPMILTGPFTGWWVPDRTGHRRRASRHHLPTALAQGQHNPSHQLSHRGPGTDLSYSRLLRHQINWPATRKADNHRAVAPPSRPRTSRAKEGNTWHPNKCLRLWSAATSSPATSHSRPSWTASSGHQPARHRAAVQQARGQHLLRGVRLPRPAGAGQRRPDAVPPARPRRRAGSERPATMGQHRLIHYEVAAALTIGQREITGSTTREGWARSCSTVWSAARRVVSVPVGAPVPGLRSQRGKSLEVMCSRIR